MHFGMIVSHFQAPTQFLESSPLICRQIGVASYTHTGSGRMGPAITLFSSFSGHSGEWFFSCSFFLKSIESKKKLSHYLREMSNSDVYIAFAFAPE
jgi:hypothetical protein